MNLHNYNYIALSIFISTPSFGAIYQCEIDGTTTFQEAPCPESTELICTPQKDYTTIFNSGKATPNEKFCYRQEAENLQRLAAEKKKKAEEQPFQSRVNKYAAREALAEAQFELLPAKEIAKTIVDGHFLVEYFAKGTSLSLTYTNEYGATEQNKIKGGWYKKMVLPIGEHVYISAQNQNDYGTIEISIRVNGTIYKQSKSNSDYGIATGSLKLSEMHRNM